MSVISKSCTILNSSNEVQVNNQSFFVFYCKLHFVLSLWPKFPHPLASSSPSHQWMSYCISELTLFPASVLLFFFCFPFFFPLSSRKTNSALPRHYRYFNCQPSFASFSNHFIPCLIALLACSENAHPEMLFMCSPPCLYLAEAFIICSILIDFLLGILLVWVWEDIRRYLWSKLILWQSKPERCCWGFCFLWVNDKTSVDLIGASFTDNICRDIWELPDKNMCGSRMEK